MPSNTPQKLKHQILGSKKQKGYIIIVDHRSYASEFGNCLRRNLCLTSPRRKKNKKKAQVRQKFDYSSKEKNRTSLNKSSAAPRNMQSKVMCGVRAPYCMSIIYQSGLVS